ncbi:MAG: hypothetical protein KAQ98_01305 [Bacteriovoracaceae bacterium]|nr:hypothetical protein [Bacteriovoracaceae bacterium]
MNFLKVFTLGCCLIFLSNLLASEIDYTYCSKYIEDANADIQKTGFSFPFEIDSKTGKVKTINNNMSFNGENKGVHVYSARGWAGQITIMIFP